MKYATLIVRIILGLAFVVFGLNGFLNFIPAPPPPEGHAGAFITALFVSKYLLVVKALEIIGGLLLLSGRFAALGLLILGPIVINIFLFHAFLAPAGLPMALVFSALAAFLLWSYRSAFAGIVKQA
jgi:putative oxidoreductase